MFLAVYWLLLALWMLYCAMENTLYFAKPPQVDGKRKKWPKISILIPARNESQRIEACLRALLELDYPNYEILILDDRSTDGTLNLVRSYAKRNARLRVFEGKALPKGWLGKPWACQQLAQKARGEWLFFIDADTWHLPETLKRTVQMAEDQKADVLSLFTAQVTRTVMEALVVPVMAFHLLAFIPARWVLDRNSRWSRFAGVSGQFIFIRRSVYKEFGGHEQVKAQIVEDLNFGKGLVQAGYRVVLGDGSEFSFCRMYTNGQEVWEGFSKNFYPAAGFSIENFLGCEIFLALSGVVPFVALGLGVNKPFFLSALLLCGTLYLVRGIHAFRYGMNPWSVFFHPLGCFLFGVIGVNSFRWFLFGKGHWKNRALKAAA